jgi:hypothetical protein
VPVWKRRLLSQVTVATGEAIHVQQTDPAAVAAALRVEADRIEIEHEHEVGAKASDA